jgi:hypothetical protein
MEVRVSLRDLTTIQHQDKEMTLVDCQGAVPTMGSSKQGEKDIKTKPKNQTGKQTL